MYACLNVHVCMFECLHAHSLMTLKKMRNLQVQRYIHCTHHIGMICVPSTSNELLYTVNYYRAVMTRMNMGL